MFKCDKCGICCESISALELYKELDEGTGTCKYFDKHSRLCTIYNNRPDICNVDKAYELYFKKEYTREEYYTLNYEMCEKLKREGALKHK